MSWSNRKFDRRLALALLGGGLVGCGFRPALEVDVQSRGAHYGKFRLPDAGDDETFALRQSLANYLGEPVAPRFQIAVSYQSRTHVLSRSEPAALTRRRLSATAMFEVIDLATGQRRLTREIQRTASYTTTSDDFASEQSLGSVRRKLAVFIGDQFAIGLIADYPTL